MRNRTSPLDKYLQRIQNEEDLKSDWKRGDRVRITSGPLRGEIGKVISASPNSVTVLTDNGEKMQVGSEDVVQNEEEKNDDEKFKVGDKVQSPFTKMTYQVLEVSDDGYDLKVKDLSSGEVSEATSRRFIKTNGVEEEEKKKKKKNFDPAQLEKWVEFQYFKADLSEGQIATIISKDTKNRMSYREALEFVEGVVASAH